MSGVIISGDVSGTVTLQAPSAAGSTVLTLPATTGTVLTSSAASASTTNTVTNKIPVVINGTTYYLLASTSGT